MAIKVNVISENTTFTVENANYATVALPITSCWGPGFSLPDEDSNIDEALENTAWSFFNASPEGLEAFIATYRGPASNYRMTKDYSYFMALSLLNAGYAIQTCRLCPGGVASTDIYTKQIDEFTGDGTKTSFTLTKTSTGLYKEVKINGESVTSDVTISGTTLTFETAPADKAVITATYSYGNSLHIAAKYPGSFGNNLRITLKKKTSGSSVYWNLIGYTVDSTGSSRAVENLVFVFESEHSTDTILSIDELQSKFFDFTTTGDILDSVAFDVTSEPLYGGSDAAYSDPDTQAADIMKDAIKYASARYGASKTLTAKGDGTKTAYTLDDKADMIISAKVTVAGETTEPPYTTSVVDNKTVVTFTTAPAANADIAILYVIASVDYIRAYLAVASSTNKSKAEALRFNEWVCTYAEGYGDVRGVYGLLRDKINYNPGRIISPWDDQDILNVNPSYPVTDLPVSPMHKVLMDVAYDSRCATAYLDVPRSLPRSRVWDDTYGHTGYAQQLSSLPPTFEDPLYASSSALFAPWGQYVYAGTTKQALATPSFMALLIERAMIKNQSAQYEWALPNTRNNNVRLGQLAYTVPKDLLDNWQASDGTRVNTITTVPSLGTTIWGNATLFDVPVATYNALMNLSTRKLINAVKDTVFKIGIGMEFQYNGQEAYAKFYAGITPLLDTMRNVGAILDYKVKMAADINNIDSINANSVVGTVYLVIAGVIENITVDLIALPQGTDLSQY